LWRAYGQLSEAEAAFRVHKSDLQIRSVWHHREDRVGAHILVCFLAYVLWQTLCRQAGLGDARGGCLKSFPTSLWSNFGRCGSAHTQRSGDPEALHQPADRTPTDSAATTRYERSNKQKCSGNLAMLPLIPKTLFTQLRKFG